MTFYESIFLRQFSMKLLGLPTTKDFFFSFILGCPQDFNFAQPFHPFSPVSTQPYQNGQAKLKSCGHPRIKRLPCLKSKTNVSKSLMSNCPESNYIDCLKIKCLKAFCLNIKIYTKLVYCILNDIL